MDTAQKKKPRNSNSNDLLKHPGEAGKHSEVLAQLQADRASHLRELERLRASLVDLPEASIEEADPSVAEQAQTRALIERIQSHLGEIERAIQSIQRADYGTCERCGQAIDPERLKVLPETRLCVKCKRESEKFKQHSLR